MDEEDGRRAGLAGSVEDVKVEPADFVNDPDRAASSD
jgi:hypothetical protein